MRGGAGVRLLDELFDSPQVTLPVEKRAGANVPVARGRMGRRNADGDDTSALGGAGGGGARFDEQIAVLHDMIGGKDPHDRVRIPPKRQFGCDRDGRSRIANGRLKHDLRSRADRLQLILGDKSII